MTPESQGYSQPSTPPLPVEPTAVLWRDPGKPDLLSLWVERPVLSLFPHSLLQSSIFQRTLKRDRERFTT